MAWPIEWDRANVLGAIEEAGGVSLAVDDSLPDTLIAKAQELGLKPVDLKLWIYDSPKFRWTVDALERWAQRAHLTHPLATCGHCGTPMFTRCEMDMHQCDEHGDKPQPPGGIAA